MDKLSIDDLRKLCGALPHVTSDFPFDADTLVFRLHGKIFALMSVDPRSHPPRITLKCEPAFADALRSTYDAVTPGYHMNKRHWNTVLIDGTIPRPEIEDLIEHAYQQVLKTLPKTVRETLIRTT